MKLLRSTSLLLLSVMVISSCLKKGFDAPPDNTGYDPMLTVTHSIKQLKALNGIYNYQTGGDTSIINQDVVISGVVVADDRSGNFYKQLVIQDSSSAIMLLLDANSLYNDYPVGRKVYVKCKGLYLGYSGGLPVLGYNPSTQLSLYDIPNNRIPDYIVKAAIGQPVLPDTVNLADIKTVTPLAEKYYNRLIYIKEAEFADTSVNFAQPNGTTNRDVQDCNGNTLAVRTSNYANFANNKLPAGKGGMLGIYTVFISSTSGNKTPQLLLRDASEVRFDGPRCGAIGGNVLLNQDFEGVSTSGNLAIAGWNNIAEIGNEPYIGATFGGTKFAKVSAFGNGAASVKTWLITPALDISTLTNPVLSFETIDGFDNGATLKIYVSTNYSGTGSPTAATWTAIPAVVSNGHASGYASTWTLSGDLSLSAFSGTIYIAFKYEGEDPTGTASDKTTTFEIDDVVVKGD